MSRRQPWRSTRQPWRSGVVRAVVRRAVVFAAVAAAVLAASPLIVLGAGTEIRSAGALTRVIVSTELNCQVAHQADVSLEFFGSETGSCGTFLAVGGTLYGPSSIPSGGGLLVTPWRPVSQSSLTGAGTRADPFTIVTVVEAVGTGIRVEETDSYVVGSQSYRTDVRLVGTGPAQLSGILYRAADCYLQDSDVGFGRVDGGAPACVISRASDARIEQWLPLTRGSRYIEGDYTDVWSAVASQRAFTDSCVCDRAVDNGAGLSWDVTVPSGGSLTISHETYFSPLGRQPTSSLAGSVPGPLDIPLDPVVVLQSAVITAGIVALVPFPAALFNSTLEEHYAEVMAGWARVRRSVGGLLAPLTAALGQAFTAIFGAFRGRRDPSAASVQGPAAASGAAVASPAAAAQGPAAASGPATASPPAAAPGPATPPGPVAPPGPFAVPGQAALSGRAAFPAEAIAWSPPPPWTVSPPLVGGTVSSAPTWSPPPPAWASTTQAVPPPASSPARSPLPPQRRLDPQGPSALPHWTATPPAWQHPSTPQPAAYPRQAPIRSAPSASAYPPAAAQPHPAPRIAPNVWSTPAGIGVFLAISALVYGLLDPTFGLSLPSLATFVGLLIALSLLVLAFTIPKWRSARVHGVRLMTRALPGTIVVAVVCVLVSRLVGFQPGYVYGLVLAYAFSQDLPLRTRGRAEAVAAAAMLVAAFAAWLVLIPIRATVSPTGEVDVLRMVVETACVFVVVAGLEGAVFAMMPIRFLPGEKVYAWDRRVWALLIGIGTFGFCHVLLDPRNGYLADQTRTSFVTVLVLLIAFGVGSIAFWAWFRYRPASRAHA